MWPLNLVVSDTGSLTTFPLPLRILHLEPANLLGYVLFASAPRALLTAPLNHFSHILPFITSPIRLNFFASNNFVVLSSPAAAYNSALAQFSSPTFSSRSRLSLALAFSHPRLASVLPLSFGRTIITIRSSSLRLSRNAASIGSNTTYSYPSASETMSLDPALLSVVE